MALQELFTQTQYSFDGKKPYEHVQVLVYRHWFILLEHFVAFVLFALLPCVAYWVIGAYLAQAHLLTLFYFLLSVYYLIWWYGLAYMVTMYMLDTWIVSDHRIIDSEQQGFFRRTVSEVRLSKIQDVSVRMRGPIATFLNYGDVLVQTAGTKERIYFKQVPDPRGIKDAIMHAHDSYVQVHKDDREVHAEDL